MCNDELSFKGNRVFYTMVLVFLLRRNIKNVNIFSCTNILYSVKTEEVQHGPYGGNGGSPNSDKDIFQGKNVTKIVLWAGAAIDSIQLRYGSDTWGNAYGSQGGNPVTIDLQDDEYITSASGMF